MKTRPVSILLSTFCLLMVTALIPCPVSAYTASISIIEGPPGFHIKVELPIDRPMQTGDMVIKYYQRGVLLLKDKPDVSEATSDSCLCMAKTPPGAVGTDLCINVIVALDQEGDFPNAWFIGHIEWNDSAFPPIPYLSSLSEDDGRCGDPLGKEIEKLEEILAGLSSEVNRHNIYIPMAGHLINAVEKAYEMKQDAFAATLAAEARLSLANMAMRTLTPEVARALGQLLEIFKTSMPDPVGPGLVRTARLQFLAGKKDLGYTTLMMALDKSFPDQYWDPDVMIPLLQAVGQTLDHIVTDAQKGLRRAEKIGGVLLPDPGGGEWQYPPWGYGLVISKTLMELRYARNELKAFDCCLEAIKVSFPIFPPCYLLASARGILGRCQNAMTEAKICYFKSGSGYMGRRSIGEVSLSPMLSPVAVQPSCRISLQPGLTVPAVVDALE